MTFSREAHQIKRFLLAGGLAVIPYYGILFGLTEIGLWYMASAVIGSTVNVAISFMLHKFWTFKNRDKSKAKRQAAHYGIMRVGIFFLNLLLLYVFVEYIHLWYMASQLIVSLIATIISYFLNRVIFAN